MPKAGEAQLRIFNGLPCDVNLLGLNSTNNVQLKPYAFHFEKLSFKDKAYDFSYTVKPGVDCFLNQELIVAESVKETNMTGHFIRLNTTAAEQFEVFQFDDDVEKSSNGYPLVR